MYGIVSSRRRIRTNYLDITFVFHIYTKECEAHDFQGSISDTSRRKRQRKITREALQAPRSCPFMTLYHSDCDTSLITMSGLDIRAFREKLNLFQSKYYRLLLILWMDICGVWTKKNPQVYHVHWTQINVLVFCRHGHGHADNWACYVRFLESRMLLALFFRGFQGGYAAEF